MSGDVVYMLMQLPPEKLTEFLTEDDTKDVVSLPAYFDDQKRVWPKPPNHIVVEFEDDPEPGSSLLRRIFL